MPRSSALRHSEPLFERSQIVQSARIGVVDYLQADRWQRERAARVAAGSQPEIVLFLEHPPTFTQGRRGGREHLLVAEHKLGAPLVDTDRGGDLTFHGPGQLVVWPILRVRERGIGIARYVRLLEESVIELAASFGLRAERVRGKPGVWVCGRKLASVGIRIQQGVSRHGFALNVNPDLRWFDSIVACGLVGTKPTTLAQEGVSAIGPDAVIAACEAAFAQVFGLRLSPVELNLERA